jgi:DNA (cytosine-5)-methyltransferase 1
MLDKKHGKPMVLFLENVKNLFGHDHGRTYRIIKSEIENLGYTVKEQVINTMDVTEIPQNRERIYIICFLNKAYAERFTAFDNLSHYKRKFSKNEREQQTNSIVKRHIKVPSKYYYSKAKYPNYFMTRQEFEKVRDQIKGNRINIEEELTEHSQFYQLRRGMYVRKNKSNVCPTLTANMGTGGHNVPLIIDDFGIRKITPTEAFL